MTSLSYNPEKVQFQINLDVIKFDNTFYPLSNGSEKLFRTPKKKLSQSDKIGRSRYKPTTNHAEVRRGQAYASYDFSWLEGLFRICCSFPKVSRLSSIKYC
jgi:hypothetical protein